MAQQQRRFRIWLKRNVPVLQWLPTYDRNDLRGDLFAGLTIGIMLIPQGMAYALLADLPPIHGLYAALIPPVVYALFGTSRQLSVGPVALISLLVADGLISITARTGLPYLTLVGTLTLMVGALKLLFGIFRLGFLVNFLSYPVISGFTSAAAVLIGINQIHHLLGVRVERMPNLWFQVQELARAAPAFNPTTVIIGGIGLGIILYLKRTRSLLPAPLLVVVAGILAVWLLKLFDKGVRVVGEVPRGLPPFELPLVEWDLLKTLFPLALTVSLIGFIQSIAVAKKIRERHRNYRVTPNQELAALGWSNVFGACFGGFPVTGGFARSVVNDQAGARTGLAGVFAAVLIGLTLLFLTPLFYFLPNAILGAIIMAAVLNLFDLATARQLFRTDRRDFWLLFVTFLATLSLGITNGILIGVGLSIATMVYFSTRPHVAELGRIPGTTHYRNVKRFDDLETDPRILLLRYDAQLYFANAEFFERTLETLIAKKGKPLCLIVLNCYGINHIDSTALNTLRELVENLRGRGIDLYFSGVIGPIRDAFNRSGVREFMGDDHFHVSIEEALDYWHDRGVCREVGYRI